ncbi:serine acetyltransferase [Thermoleptolyngbya sp.]
MDEFRDELRDEFRDVEFAIAQPDWSREALERWWDPGRQLVRSIRRYQKWRQRGGLLGRLGSKVAVLHYRFWSVVSASEIHLTCKLGGGLLLTHPNGVIIHPDAEVGANCLILQQVTLVAGVKVGNGVDIGAGAKLIRPVRLAIALALGPMPWWRRTCAPARRS